MRRWTTGLLALLVALSFGSSAFAQGGGASSTGTIQGRVTDSQGAVLPGVTVTATSPALIQPQTTVTSETGNYRFPAVPPGTFELTYELAGFNTLKRSGISITLGFTANVNVELSLATLQETVTVTGESPIIDTTATRVQQNFKLEQLQSIPNGRDMWSLLAVTPSVQMGRIDVGGNRAGTQTPYQAYGFSGQVRVLIEGINTTEGTGAAGFYFDYSSLEEVFLGTSGQSAEMPNPGVQSQFIAKSGGNMFSGEYYLDWYNNSLQGSNIPDDYIDGSRFNGNRIRAHSNEIDRYYDTAINVGGPIKRDRAWWFATYRTQFNAVAQPSFRFDQTFNTKLWNPVGKVTYQANQKNKLIGYYQWGQKHQPTRLVFNALYDNIDSTVDQNSGSWVWKGEWNGTLSDKLYVEARVGSFGYYFPLIANSDEPYFFRDAGTLEIRGAERRWQLDRERNQYTGAATYFLDSGMGSHTFKIGAELLKEVGWQGFEQGVGGNIEHVYNNNASSQVFFRIPTAKGVDYLKAGKKGDLTAVSALNHLGFFINDTWNAGRMTLNAGVRFDRYSAFLPEQEQLGATVGPVTVVGRTFPESDLFTWNVAAPRVGVIYDLSGDGRTVIKGNYGFFWHNPGVTVGDNANPNTSTKFEQWTWNDINGDRRWQLGENGTLLARALEGSIRLDPDLKQPYSHEASVWVERQIGEVWGVRTGYVYKTEDDLTCFSCQMNRPPSAFTAPFTFTDTMTGRAITLLGIPSASAGDTTQFVTSGGDFPLWGRYKTYELALTKRYGNRWSAQLGGSYSWTTDFNLTASGAQPQRSPNNPGAEDRTLWNVKFTGAYDAAWGIRLSPVLRHQSGANYARTFIIPSSAGLITSAGFTTGFVEPMDANREDNITVLDVRAEKTVNFNDRIRARLFLDVFNITNSHASETISRATGSAYQLPTAILAPITARLGFRFLW
ncbi:MAG TPA: carboxypeptidase regulatory-like domain-containing protein [Vicinamibacterales bacterium]|nr:carboxypeptidase regulatory-like domain-containing protein [Vicinamibacterales bacterium]